MLKTFIFYFKCLFYNQLRNVNTIKLNKHVTIIIIIYVYTCIYYIYIYIYLQIINQSLS